MAVKARKFKVDRQYDSGQSWRKPPPEKPTSSGKVKKIIKICL